VPGGVAEVCRKGYLCTSPEVTFFTVSYTVAGRLGRASRSSLATTRYRRRLDWSLAPITVRCSHVYVALTVRQMSNFSTLRRSRHSAGPAGWLRRRTRRRVRRRLWRRRPPLRRRPQQQHPHHYATQRGSRGSVTRSEPSEIYLLHLCKHFF
jgi:hypothetical protein